MTFKVTGKELGIQDCDFKASGDTAGDVARQVVNHLRDEHDLDMPDADTILEGNATDAPLDEADPGVALVVERMSSALNILPPEETEMTQPFVVPKFSTSTQ